MGSILSKYFSFLDLNVASVKLARDSKNQARSYSFLSQELDNEADLVKLTLPKGCEFTGK